LAYAMRGQRGSEPEALRLAEESLSRCRAADDDAGAAGALRLVAILRAARGDIALARDAAGQAQALYSTLDRPFDLAWTLRQVGVIELADGRLAEAGEALAAALRLFAEIQDVSSMPVLLDDLAALARAEGESERAGKLSAAATALQASTGADWAGVVRRLRLPDAARMPEHAGLEPAAAAAIELSRDDVVAYALDVAGVRPT